MTIFKLADLEAWEERPDYQLANDGRGMCNTGWGEESGLPHSFAVVCALGGIGCNVNHALIAAGNGIAFGPCSGPGVHETVEPLYSRD